MSKNKSTKNDQADDTTAPETPPASTSSPAPAAGPTGSDPTSSPAAAAAAGTTGADQVAADVDQQIQALGARLGPDFAPLLSLLATLHGRQRTVEQHVQMARGEQIDLRNQVSDLHRVVTTNADNLDGLGQAVDQLADLVAPPPPPPAPAPPLAIGPRGNPVNPFTLPQRPAQPQHVGMGLGGIAGRRRDRGARRFETPQGGLPQAPAAPAAPVLPPHNPNASSPPPALPEAQIATRPHADAVVLDELQIDPRQLGPGEHEITTPSGRQVLVRVREQARPSAWRRQGGGRTFSPRPVVPPSTPDGGQG